MPESLFQRRLQAYTMAGDVAGAAELTERYLRYNPTSRAALSAAAQLAIDRGDSERARSILSWLRDNGGSRDVQLLSDLAVLQVQAGDIEAAQRTALASYHLQRSSPVASQALAFSYAADGRRRHMAPALLDKAYAMLGNTPLIAQVRRMLAAGGLG